MAIYKAGTLSVTANSTTVTGQGTAFTITGVAGGLLVLGGVSALIASVESETSLTLSQPWAGDTQAGAEYSIHLVAAEAASTVAASARIAELVASIGDQINLVDLNDFASGDVDGNAENALQLGGRPAAEFVGAIDHASLTNNPHGVTKGQVGLGNVNNTADADKPISTAVQTALNGVASIDHTHGTADITDLQSTLANVLVGGNRINVVGNDENGTIEISSTDGGVAEDSAQLNGEDASFYRDASNLNAGVINSARLPIATPSQGLDVTNNTTLLTPALGAALYGEGGGGQASNIVFNSVTDSILYPASTDLHIAALDTTITKGSADTFIKVEARISFERGSTNGVFYIRRNGVEIGSAEQDGNRSHGMVPVPFDGNDTATMSTINALFLDETVGDEGEDITYSFHVRGDAQSLSLNITRVNNNSTDRENATSQVYLEEVGQSSGSGGSGGSMDPLILAHVDATNNPHSVTAEQVGLGDVDNTSDADKPISTATQAALDDAASNTETALGDAATATQTALDGKAPVDHTHSIDDIEGLTNGVDGVDGDDGTRWFTGNDSPSGASIGDLWLRSGDGQVLELQSGSAFGGPSFQATPTNLTGPPGPAAEGGAGGGLPPLALGRDPLHGVGINSRGVTVGGMASAQFRLLYMPDDMAISRLSFYVQLFQADTNVRAAIYKAAVDGGIGELVKDCGSVTAINNLNTMSFESTDVEQGFYYIVIQSTNSAMTFRGALEGSALALCSAGHVGGVINSGDTGRIAFLGFDDPFPTDMTDFGLGGSANQIQYLSSFFFPNVVLRP